MNDSESTKPMLTDATNHARNVQDHERMVRAAPVGILAVDDSGTIVMANALAEETFGYDEGEMTGLCVEKLIPERLRAGHQRYRQAFHADPTPRTMGAGRELYGLRRDGSEFPIEVGLSPVRLGEQTLVMTSVLDITEQKRSRAILEDSQAELERMVNERTEELTAARRDLERQAAELKRSNEALEEFAYVASHDLQEPLRSISSYLQLLDRRYGEGLDDKAAHFLGRAVAAAERMKGLIRDLLTYSRVTTHSEPRKPVSPRKVVSEALEDLRKLIRDTGAVVSVGDLPESIDVDETQFRQLMQNLIENALKFHKPDSAPVVAVDATCEDGEWTFAVTDNGIGIEPGQEDRIFQVFQRLHGRDTYPGSGMGLALCRRIVERHGGRIGVTSAPGGGSTFRFTIPDRKEGPS